MRSISVKGQNIVLKDLAEYEHLELKKVKKCITRCSQIRTLTYDNIIIHITYYIFVGITTVLTMTFLGLEARKDLPKVMTMTFLGLKSKKDLPKLMTMTFIGLEAG